MSIPNQLVTIAEASEIIGVSIVSLHGSKATKYSRFRYKTKGRAVMFDVAGFEKMDNMRVQLVEKVKLFVEYLKHIENMTYDKIATIAKIYFQDLYSFNFGYGVGYKILRAFAIQRPFHLKRFDDYYGWEHTPKKTIKVLG